MITLLFILASLAFAGETTAQCTNVAGIYNIADGRGRPVGENVFATIDQTDCSVIVAFQEEQHEGTVEGNSIRSADGQYTGNIDDEGRILWSNGFYYIPEFMHIGEELFPVDCLHPFSLYCHQECSSCVPCALDQPTDIDCGSECGHCEMCLDYVPCLEPIQGMPECVEPEAFDCLRECRECAPCAEFDECLEVTSAVDPICLEPRAGECLQTCGDCIPCASGDSPFMDCSECARCEDCLPYAGCLDQVEAFPAELRKCVSPDAITCFHDCQDCSSCADKFYCLEAFEGFQPPVVDPPALGDQYVEISGYPCDTHGQPAYTLNQAYFMRGQGANGRPIFQGREHPQWWIYWDDNCGETEPAHSPAWYLTDAAPDFAAPSNLAGGIDGCTNTLRIDQEFGFPYTVWAHSFMCDESGWENEYVRNGHKVEVKFLLDDPSMCCMAMTADCLACSASMSVEDYCDMFPETDGCAPPPMCCKAMTADCLACSVGMSVEDYCNMFPETNGCMAMPSPCHQDDEHFKAIVNAMPADGSPTWFDWVDFVNDNGCHALADSSAAHDWCPLAQGACDCICQTMPPTPCHQDDEHFKAIVNDMPADGSPTWFDWVDFVNERGCQALVDLDAAHDWCHLTQGACDCICQKMPSSPEECGNDEHCLYPGCEADDFNTPRCENRGDYGVCMVGEMVCPKRPEDSHRRGEPELCTQNSDCSYSTCDIDGYSLGAQCSGADDASRDCEKGECVCVHGNTDFRCEGKPNNFDLLDGGWCYDGRRDAHCPLNPDRNACLEISEGNFQLNDKDSGEVLVHMAVKQYGCQGEAKTSDNSYLRLEFFHNQILAIDEEGRFYTGIQEVAGTFLWNDQFRMTHIPCMFVFSGPYNLVNIDGHIRGMHHISQDGCNAVSKDNDGHEFYFEMTDSSISGTIMDGQFITGSLIEDSFVLQWDIGYQSHPLFEYEHPQCNEDGHRFAEYVRSVASNMENPKIVDFVNRINWEGCNVLRHDHDAKYDWCTFHPEARDACSCVCNEVNHPKPVCSHEQISSWIHRDLSYECSELFVAGLAEEHRPACGCLKTIDELTANDLFGSECFFTEWSDRSFMQMWRDCQWH